MVFMKATRREHGGSKIKEQATLRPKLMLFPAITLLLLLAIPETSTGRLKVNMPTSGFYNKQRDDFDTIPFSSSINTTQGQHVHRYYK